jgi:hypothetical protein
VSLPALSVTVDQLPGKLPQAPFVKVAVSRSSVLVLASRLEPPSVPPFFVTGIELLV